MRSLANSPRSRAKLTPKHHRRKARKPTPLTDAPHLIDEFSRPLGTAPDHVKGSDGPGELSFLKPQAGPGVVKLEMSRTEGQHWEMRRAAEPFHRFRPIQSQHKRQRPAEKGLKVGWSRLLKVLPLQLNSLICPTSLDICSALGMPGHTSI